MLCCLVWCELPGGDANGLRDGLGDGGPPLAGCWAVLLGLVESESRKLCGFALAFSELDAGSEASDVADAWASEEDAGRPRAAASEGFEFGARFGALACKDEAACFPDLPGLPISVPGSSSKLPCTRTLALSLSALSCCSRVPTGGAARASRSVDMDRVTDGEPLGRAHSRPSCGLARAALLRGHTLVGPGLVRAALLGGQPPGLARCGPGIAGELPTGQVLPGLAC